MANWNTPVSPTGGGLAAWRNFVFATDRLVAPDSTGVHEGIVRFDIEANTVQRFPDDGDFLDLAVGLDGLLYGLGSGERTAGTQWVRVYRPQNMQFVREFRLNVPNPTLGLMTAITVDRNGQVYAVRYDDGVVYHFTANGQLARSYDTGLNPAGQAGEAKFSDIDLHENNRDLLISNINFSNSTSPTDCDVVLLTTAFAGRQLLQAPDATSDMKFVAWVQAPVGAINGPLTVSRLHAAPARDAGALADGTFDYTPDPDFAGQDSFTYVVQDGDGLAARHRVPHRHAAQ